MSTRRPRHVKSFLSERSDWVVPKQRLGIQLFEKQNRLSFLRKLLRAPTALPCLQSQSMVPEKAVDRFAAMADRCS